MPTVIPGFGSVQLKNCSYERWTTLQQRLLKLVSSEQIEAAAHVYFFDKYEEIKAAQHGDIEETMKLCRYHTVTTLLREAALSLLAATRLREEARGTAWEAAYLSLEKERYRIWYGIYHALNAV